MASTTGDNPEDEYADEEYADNDAEDREQPSAATEIPDDEPEDDALEQRQDVPTATTSGNGRPVLHRSRPGSRTQAPVPLGQLRTAHSRSAGAGPGVVASDLARGVRGRGTSAPAPPGRRPPSPPVGGPLPQRIATPGTAPPTLRTRPR